MEVLNIIVLTLSGLALFYASYTRLINPTKAIFLQTYLAKSENEPENDADLVNEVRGIGAVMLLGGIMILLGALFPDFRLTSFVVAIVLLFGVILGRLISFGVDGRPSQDIVRAAMIEMILGGLNIICLVNLF